MRRTDINGKECCTQLQDLKKGDTVCVSWYGHRYYNTKVTRVRTVECGTIITVEKIQDLPKRYVGYYTGKIATSDCKAVLTLDTYWGDEIKNSMESAAERSEKIVNRAKALRALRDIKTWLNQTEDWRDKDVE